MSSLPVGSFVGNDYVGGAGGPWDDIQGAVNPGDAVANPTYEAYRDTPWKTYFFRHDQADELHISLQMSHSWDRGQVRFHIHLIPMVNPVAAQIIALAGRYSWATGGVETPANATWTPWTASSTVSTTGAFKEIIVPCFTATPPVGSLESAILLIYLKRDSGGADTYTTGKSGGTAAANVCILSLDAHYQKNKDGTSVEIPVL